MSGLQHERLLNLAEKHLSERQNIAPAIADLRANPSTFDQIIDQFDSVVTTFNRFTDIDMVIEDSDTAYFPHAIELGERLVFQPLPQLGQLQKNCPKRIGWAGHRALNEANHLMQQGETTTESEDSSAWRFHRELTSAKDLTAALLFELYGLIVTKLHPNVFPHDVVVALEELLPVYHPDTVLFSAVKKWYTEEEGFSPELIILAQQVGNPVESEAEV